MRNPSTVVALLAFLVTLPAQAADPVLEQKIESLAQRVTTLTNELNALKSIMSRASDGTVMLAAAVNRDDRVGASSRTTIGQNQAISVGGAQQTYVGGDLTTQAGRTITLTAGDQLTLRTGTALLVMKKDGTVQISGTRILISSAGEVAIKGSKILQN